MTARVTDALDNLDFAMGLGLIDDVDSTLAPVYEFAEMVANTRKPLLAWGFSVENLIDIYRIAAVVAGGEENLQQRPFFAWFASMQPSLQHPDQELQQILWAVDHGIPVVYTGCGVAGQSAPVTGAGMLVIYLMSALSSLAIIQLHRPGAPICIGGVPAAMDLRTVRPSYGGPELSLYSAAMGDISRYLNLPMMGTAGASEAKSVDLQAAVESTVQAMLSELSGATLVHDVGFLDCADIGSLEMLILNDEIISMVRHIMRGIEVTDETMMVDLIDQIGPGGEYMSAFETARRCRSEIWMPKLMNRTPRATWESNSGASFGEAISQRLKEILAQPHPAPLSPKKQSQIDGILREAETRREVA
jgi:trimethylamine---corrinoid protein Co-methyltransferase